MCEEKKECCQDPRDLNGDGKVTLGEKVKYVADKAGEKICKAILARKREVLVGRKELLMVYIKRFFPGLCAKLSRKIEPM